MFDFIDAMFRSPVAAEVYRRPVLPLPGIKLPLHFIAALLICIEIVRKSMSRILKLFVASAAVAAGLAVVHPAQATEGDYTLIVAPARYSVIQMSFDVIKKRPAVLVSYRGEASTSEPLLYAWNGTEWIHITLQDYRDVRFLQDTPRQVVMLGDENTLPASLKNATGWAKHVQVLKDVDNASLVNEFGRLFQWTPEEWQWFSGRYNLKLQDEAEPFRHSSWYDQPGPIKRETTRAISTPPPFSPSPATNTAPEMPPVKIQDTPASPDAAKPPPGTLPLTSTPQVIDIHERAQPVQPTTVPKP